MANEVHLSLIKQGPHTWNEWRLVNQTDKPDLSKAVLTAAELRGADLRAVDLRGANLRGADLREAKLQETNLWWADLSWAQLDGANLSGAYLERANLNGANLSLADLSNAKMREANLWEAKLGRAKLQRTNLVWAYLGEADLKGADLSRAFLGNADLSIACLDEANLREANLKEANLTRAHLEGANFERAKVGYTIFGGVDLSSCTGLDSVNHAGPSTLGVDSIIRSNGRIPEAFLRGVGLPDGFIAYIPSLLGEGKKFFSCFISYSSLDKPFAVRLYEALQSNGVRCWLDEKRLLPGDKISREVGRGIRDWDKFLLCASKNSLTSPWVEEEIETTLEGERTLRSERGKEVLKLIPLNLDGYMFSKEWELGSHAAEVRSRVAADFQGWETDSFNFDDQVRRVIKALRADEGACEAPPPPLL
jgi:uncharacterized protein YjbI with pentapeptide repeats